MSDQTSGGRARSRPAVLARQLPFFEMTDNLKHSSDPRAAKWQDAPAALTRDQLFPWRRFPQTAHFVTQVADTSVEFRPVKGSWQRCSVYSPIA